jgi:hypothetical protein
LFAAERKGASWEEPPSRSSNSSGMAYYIRKI